MRRALAPLLAALLAASLVPTELSAQSRPGQRAPQDDGSAGQQGRQNDEWTPRLAPLRGRPNAGPCPYVKILYDAARYIDFGGAQPSSTAVVNSGEIEGLSSACTYRGADPISVDINILFHLGRGPQAQGSQRTYRYWIAVTERNNAILAKEYFDLPVTFPAGADRVFVTEEIRGLTIPRADITTSGSNFEILIGFDVTEDMAEFNRTGSRFTINAGQNAGQP
ncbi:MAG: Tat pathway signal sequence domain protein [Brevundimonas sp.]|uniref:Tat pathway signal sequence domain protein n=1 Tax=Brevundimonas sp. TaxID=1871086 RepID=UPI00391B1685